ncbi:MAG: mechanosensitive ion channel family protein [Chloroflexi bacterium]|nr:mechanosensitive ion channel family protein [Chloroflexota bacterium]
MDGFKDWVDARWQDTLVPLAVFVGSLAVLLWARRSLRGPVGCWVQRTRWQGDDILFHALRLPSLLWVALFSIFLGLQASQVSSQWKSRAGDGLWSASIASVALLAIQVAAGLFTTYRGRFNVPEHTVRTASFGLTGAIVFMASLAILEVWGAPIGPLLLAIGIVAVIAALALRDVLPSTLAALQISATGQVKEGDYIRLQTGEEGYVVEVGWRNVQLKGLDDSVILVPTAKLARTTVVNYGRTLKRAKEPFRFSSRTHVKQLTGLKARNARELAEVLKQVPDSVVYYHTHHFLEEHHYLTPQPASDFALWASTCLGDEVLGEKLAAVDIFQFPTLGAVRERLVGIIEEHLASARDGRSAPEGQEFHFVKSSSFIMPTTYVAHDLRGLAEALRKLPLDSLYFHVFESRLRLGRSTNDFSAWLEASLGEEELAEQIAWLDPYNYSLEGLRSLLIQLVEKRVT